MNIQELCETVLAGTIGPLPAEDETAWCEIWRRHIAGVSEPLVMSALGGAFADRLAWVFHAGYQGAIRHTFPDVALGGRWASYVTSEDREGRLPGTTLSPTVGVQDVLQLSGHKSWVAAARGVELLVVSVGTGSEQRFVLVNRDAPGVEIDAGTRPGFLAELSQGRARFRDVEVSSRAITGSRASALAFGIAEPLHVLTALNAFMLSHAWTWRSESPTVETALLLLAAAGTLGGRQLTASDVVLTVAGLDRSTRELAGQFEVELAASAPDVAGRWGRDRRLVSFYERGTAAGAARVRGRRSS